MVARYSCYAKAILFVTFLPEKFISVGSHLSSNVIINAEGNTVIARAHTDDLEYYIHSVKVFTNQHFCSKSNEVVVAVQLATSHYWPPSEKPGYSHLDQLLNLSVFWKQTFEETD